MKGSVAFSAVISSYVRMQFHCIEEMMAERGTKAALRFLSKAISRNGKPGLVNIDKSGANKAGINQFNEDNNRRVKIRQCKYLNNMIEQGHRRVKWITRPMLGFKKLPLGTKYLGRY